MLIIATAHSYSKPISPTPPLPPCPRPPHQWSLPISNQATNEGASPVVIASQKGHMAAIKLLLENGGDANQAMNDGATSVFIASQNIYH